MQFTANPTGGVLTGTFNRDIFTLGSDGDIVELNRDGKTDTVLNFDLGSDKIDLSKFNVTWDEVETKHISGNEFVFTIRGERTKVTLTEPDAGQSYDFATLDADDFIFNEGATAPQKNILLDPAGASRILGTDQPDNFIVQQDNTRDVIVDFDPQKDLIDLSAFGTLFDELSFTDKKAGKVVINLGSEGLVIRDISREMTSTDFTEDMFIF